MDELRALVIDDDIDGATSLSYLLQVLGCKTAVAFGGGMGLRVASLFQPSIVFLDLNMPGQDGCEVLAEARRAGGPLGQALYVCLTGQAGPSDEARCLSAGFDLFIKKPIRPDDLNDILLRARQRGASLTAA